MVAHVVRSKERLRVSRAHNERVRGRGEVQQMWRETGTTRRDNVRYSIPNGTFDGGKKVDHVCFGQIAVRLQHARVDGGAGLRMTDDFFFNIGQRLHTDAVTCASTTQQKTSHTLSATSTISRISPHPIKPFRARGQTGQSPKHVKLKHVEPPPPSLTSNAHVSNETDASSTLQGSSGYPHDPECTRAPVPADASHIAPPSTWSNPSDDPRSSTAILAPGAAPLASKSVSDLSSERHSSSQKKSQPYWKRDGG